jgi:anti-sigma factor RsiW
MTSESDRLNPELIQDYIDNRLGDATREEIEAYLDRNPEARRRVDAYREQEQALRRLYDGVLDEEIPDRLRAVAHRAVGRRERRGPRGPWALLATAAMAAGMLSLGGIAGWALRGDLQRQNAVQVASDDFLQRASSAFAAYATPNAPWSESTSVSFSDISGWLKQTLGVPIAESALASAGFEFVTARPLPYPNGQAGELVFRNSQGQRLTLYFQMHMSPTGSGAPASASGQPQGTFVQRDKLSIYYWQKDPVAVALIGPLQQQSLIALAESLFQPETFQPQKPTDSGQPKVEM